MIIRRLASTHDRSSFDCGEESLNRFIRQFAGQDAGRNLGVTFVALEDSGDARILGYYTLATGQVEPNLVSSKKLPAHRPVLIILLGRLAVDRSCQGRHLGELLLFDALARSLMVSEEVGAFAVVFDALHENARRFYARYGFKCFSDDPLHLFIPMNEVRKLNLVCPKSR